MIENHFAMLEDKVDPHSYAGAVLYGSQRKGKEEQEWGSKEESIDKEKEKKQAEKSAQCHTKRRLRARRAKLPREQERGKEEGRGRTAKRRKNPMTCPRRRRNWQCMGRMVSESKKAMQGDHSWRHLG